MQDRAQITAKSEQKKRDSGLVLKRGWIPDTPEAIEEFKKQIEKINKRFNCINFK